MKDLQGKAAFVTGGANGIGRAIAESFAREGVAVAIADIDPRAAEKTCKEIEASGARAIPVECDVTRNESLAEALRTATETLGPIHLLVNNAGAFAVSPLEETSRRDWEWLLEVNVVGVVNGLHTFLPHMRAHGEPAHIINTGSVAGHIAGPGVSVYTASKFAVVGLTECLRAELADTQIGVSILCPGVVKTGLIDSSREHRPERHGGRDADPGVDVAAITDNGTDPAMIGDRVVAAVKAGEFYIFTHPDLKPAFEARFTRILNAHHA
jgi:NAD(P)-dependent dehydrogenase (short-subunit alcohol dehydrogenase family)